MRKTHHEPRALEPLPLARSDELIDDALRVIREIAELRFPNRQTLRRDEGITQFETERAEFGQGGIAHDERRLVRPEVVQGDVLRLVLLIVDHRVSLGERPSLDILSAHANMAPLERETAKRQRLGRTPVDTLAFSDRLAPLREHSRKVPMGSEALWII